MALIICPECSNDVSDKANNCPRCGHPLKPVFPQSRAELDAQILRMLMHGNKGDAINLYKDYTSAGPEDARRYVEDIEFSFPENTDTTLPPLTISSPSPSHASPIAVFRGLLLLMALAIAVVFGVRWIWHDAVSSASSSVSSAPLVLSSSFTPVSTVSWSEIDAIYNMQSKETDLRKNEFWKRYKGMKVKWKGTVRAVSDNSSTLSLQVKMNPDTLTSDLLIKLRESERMKALNLKEGDLVTFTGILEEWGSVLPIILNEGEIK